MIMARTITGVLVSTATGKAGKKTIEAELRRYYQILGCDTIDIVSRKIGGKYYDIICDDEALLKADPVFTAVDVNYQPMLYGSLFICNHDDEGNETSLTPEDVDNVLSACDKAYVRLIHKDDETLWKLQTIARVEY